MRAEVGPLGNGGTSVSLQQQPTVSVMQQVYLALNDNTH